MPTLRVNGHDHYYEETGHGSPLVFVHGAFVDSRIWDNQWRHFSAKARLLRYDLRGHGRTGPSNLSRYTMDTFADDLSSLLNALGIDSAIVCGHSWGGGIAQAFAVTCPERLRGLVLSGSTVSMSLTFGEKLLRYVLFPRSAMDAAIRTLSPERYVRFSLWLAGMTLGRRWLGRNTDTLDYLRECMLGIQRDEYLKIWGAIYAFDMVPLERIACPTLVINGGRDARRVLRHASEIVRRVPHAEARELPGSYHAIPLEEPQAYNDHLEEMLRRSAWQVAGADSVGGAE